MCFPKMSIGTVTHEMRAFSFPSITTRLHYESTKGIPNPGRSTTPTVAALSVPVRTPQGFTSTEVVCLLSLQSTRAVTTHVIRQVRHAR
jgi:hypothetical protein